MYTRQMSGKVQLQTPQESLVASAMSGRNLGDMYIEGGGALCARRLRNLLGARGVNGGSERDESLWLTRRASENIYVGGKAVIIKFEEFMACKQASNKPSEWDGVMHGAAPHSTCLSFAIHRKSNVSSTLV